MTEKQLVKYDITDAAIAKLGEQYGGLTIANSNYETVSKAISEVRTLRTSVEKKRKELKSDALEYGRKVDSEAKRITGLLVDIETPLKDEKQKIDDEKARIKEEKEKADQERIENIKEKIDAIAKFNLQPGVIPSSDEVRKLIATLLEAKEDGFDYQEFADKAKTTFDLVADQLTTCLENAIKYEDEVAELERKHKEQEAEAEKLRKEREEINKQRDEMAKIQKERDDAELKAKLEKEAKEKAEREVAEAAERKIKEEAAAKLKAEEDEKARIAEEAKELAKKTENEQLKHWAENQLPEVFESLRYALESRPHTEDDIVGICIAEIDVKLTKLQEELING